MYQEWRKILNVEYVQTENSDREHWLKEKTLLHYKLWHHYTMFFFLIYNANTQYLVSNSHECTTPSFLKLDNIVQ